MYVYLMMVVVVVFFLSSFFFFLSLSLALGARTRLILKPQRR